MIQVERSGGSSGMPLRFDLGPFEKLFIGKSVLINNGTRTMFVVEGETPILRAKDILLPNQAVNVVEKLYRCVQQTYLEEDAQKYKSRYIALMAQAISECPERRTDLRIADQLVKEGRHYQALRALRKLIGQKAFGEGENSALV
jgi:flagellar protein FlbT